VARGTAGRAPRRAPTARLRRRAALARSRGARRSAPAPSRPPRTSRSPLARTSELPVGVDRQADLADRAREAALGEPDVDLVAGRETGRRADDGAFPANDRVAALERGEWRQRPQP